MKPFTHLTMLALAALLAGCGGEPATDESATANIAKDDKAAPGSGAMATGTATVAAIDKAAGTITLNHGPIPEANWPAMTMAFAAPPTLIDSVDVGDQVAFDLALKDGVGEVTAIRKEP